MGSQGNERRLSAGYVTDCRMVPSAEDEAELGFLARRVRWRSFFARRWILVEGVTEYLCSSTRLAQLVTGRSTLMASARNRLSAKRRCQALYPALAQGFGIPWHMIVDGDKATGFKQQILDRGFDDSELDGRFASFPPPNGCSRTSSSPTATSSCCCQILLRRPAPNSALTCPLEEFGRG